MRTKFVFLSMALSIFIFGGIFFEKSFSKDFLEQVAEGIVKKSFERLSSIRLNDIKQFFENSTFKKQVINQIMDRNPHRYAPALVKSGPKKLIPGHSLEGDFLVQRLENARVALERLTGIKIEHEGDTPRIGFVFSGGGYRAMTLTAGYMRGFEQLGLVDTALYMAGLSGSTWWIGPYIFMHAQDKNISVKDFDERLKEKIRKNVLNPVSTTNTVSLSSQRLANDLVFPKVVFGQPLSSVDFYGGLVAHALLSDFSDAQQKQQLSNQWYLIKTGNVPWPIYTAVSEYPMAKYVYMYHWYEFNPEEVRNLENNFSIPAFAFGRKFDKGAAQDFAPEQSFGFLMGIFGSAYTISLQDIKRMMILNNVAQGGKDSLQAEQNAEKLLIDIASQENVDTENEVIKLSENQSKFDAIKEALMNMVVGSLSDTRIGNQRLAPAIVHNPFKNYVHASPWMREQDTTMFVDAGLAYNIPLRPLFEPNRALDIIFVADSSSNIAYGDELKKAFADIDRTWGITYGKSLQESDKTVHVYRAENNAKAPIVVYINFLKDELLLEKAAQSNFNFAQSIAENDLQTFDVEACLAQDYCNTFNFNYSLKDFNQLSLLAFLNVMMHRELFIQLIEERIGKQEPYEFGS